MPLVRRQKGEAVHLPDGVVARMQFSPYRVQLAGIRTAAVEYRPLAREIVTPGIVSVGADTEPPDELAIAFIDAEIEEQDIPLISMDTAARVTSEALFAHAAWQGRIAAIKSAVNPRSRRVSIQVAADDPQRELWPGMRVKLCIQRPMADLEPFCSLPSDPPPLATGELRKLYTCPEHPHVLRET
ncbi:MAG TPA: efflux RND transporter periplasmic adaptor subunit, partial [Pirellulales bacterium]|nr:efflux RND transporter periplasmic adaptor subunit [Pirellulales bacterium]